MNLWLTKSASFTTVRLQSSHIPSPSPSKFIIESMVMDPLCKFDGDGDITYEQTFRVYSCILSSGFREFVKSIIKKNAFQ